MEKQKQIIQLSPEKQDEVIKHVKNYIEWLRYPASRPITPVEYGNNEVSSMPNWERVRSISEARQLAQNSVAVISFLEAFCNHGIDQGGNCVFTTSNKKWNSKAKKLMDAANRDCDYRVPRMNLNTYLRTSIQTIIRDGDFTVVVDPDITDNKFLTYEADQVCQINDNQWKEFALENGYTYKDNKGEIVPCKQFSGVFTDGHGKIKGVICTMLRGLTTVDKKDVTVFTPDLCQIVLKTARFSQYRGNSMLLAMLTVIADMGDLISAEVQSAKRQAIDAVVVSQENPMEQMLNSLGLSQEQLTEGTQQTLTPTAPSRYQNLENLYGGGTVYVNSTDKIEHLKNERPSPDITAFEHYAKQSTGGSLGLYKMFSTLEVSTSFSAARAELHLTWAAFRAFQKLLENQVIDFRNTKLINSWVEQGLLGAIPDDLNPVETYQVQWNEPPQLNPMQEVQAALLKIKGGLSNWSIENGCESDQILSNLKHNIDFLKENGLDMLSFFEDKKGDPTTQTPIDESSANPEDPNTPSKAPSKKKK